MPNPLPLSRKLGTSNNRVFVNRRGAALRSEAPPADLMVDRVFHRGWDGGFPDDRPAIAA